MNHEVVFRLFGNQKRNKKEWSLEGIYGNTMFTPPKFHMFVLKNGGKGRRSFPIGFR